MTVTFDKGTRGEGDRIIKWNNTPLSVRDLSKILLLLWENEDKRHPPPQRGAKMLLDFINELFEKRESTSDMIKRYML